MTLRSKIFIRIMGLVLGMILIVTWLACAFAARHYRDNTVDLMSEQLLILSDRAAELVAWDDRLGLKDLLQGLVGHNSVVTYAVLERFDRPYVHTFESGVPRGLLDLESGEDGRPAVHAIENVQGERFIHLAEALPVESAVLHAGLSVAQIHRQILPQILS